MARDRNITEHEVMIDENELIVSKTDPKGRITYCNQYFRTVAGYTENELIGAPHSILRHPWMPRAVFKLMWQVIEGGDEIFAYVVNRCKNGDHYWVFAHVTPSLSSTGQIVGYHSNRRAVDMPIVRETIEPLYRKIRAEEERHADRKAGLSAGEDMINAFLREQGSNYEEFIAGLGPGNLPKAAA